MQDTAAGGNASEKMHSVIKAMTDGTDWEWKFNLEYA